MPTCKKHYPFLLLVFATMSLFKLYAQAGQPIFIKTSGKLPQLAWSNGADRLGSAKMGYIDTGIVLFVADTLPGLYKVKLSQNRHAYLAKENATPVVQMVSPGIPTTSESWSVKGSAFAEDTLGISLGRKVAYQSRMEMHPARIVIQLYGVQANTNWITQLQSAREITSVDYKQVEDDVVEATIYLKHKQHYGHHIIYKGNRLMVIVRVPPSDKKLKGKTIVVDAGHGGNNTGARGGTSGILEKQYTLLIAQALEKELTGRGARVLMVRNSDTAIDNKDRVLWTMQQKPDIFISIHLNSAGRKTAKGVSTYYKNIGYRSLSEAILKQMLAIKGLDEFGLVGSFNFQPVQPTNYPSSLVEVAFLSNPEDEKLIQDASFRKKAAHQIMLGVKDWLSNITAEED